MWRRNDFPENRDSDESISEEDEYGNADFGGNDISPSRNSKEEGLLLQTRLEKLIGCGEVNYAIQTSNISPEDDVEVPDFQDESNFAPLRRPGSACMSDDEIPHDSKMAIWSTLNKETKTLIHLNGNASSSSSRSAGSRTKRCNKDQVQRKFSFHSHSHGERFSKRSVLPENLETADQAVEEDPIAELHGFDEETENRQGVTVAASRVIQNRCMDRAISKLLNNPPDASGATKRSFNPYRGRRGRSLNFKGNSSTIQERVTDDELPGPMDSEWSSDDEPGYQSSKQNTRDQKERFVGDRFDEALKAASLSNGGLLFTSPKLSGSYGLYGKLHQVIKREREIETEILKTLQIGVEQRDASRYMDVRILSRRLEARLVVCKCSNVNGVEDSPLPKISEAVTAKEKETTMVFSTKVCGDVDIEAGSFIRIYTPWKEVELKNAKEVIILCSYFSNILLKHDRFINT